MKPAVVLVSGGLDSATTLAIAKEHHFTPHALTFDYGQRHRVEIERAEAVCRLAGVSQRIMRLDLSWMTGSALTGDLAVPKDRDPAASIVMIPVTYVPARNTIFLSVALGYAETIGAFDLFIGANVVDYSGYPDCRPAYLDAFAALANLATRAAVEGQGEFRLHAPLLYLTKAQIIRRALDLGVDLAQTHSCYDPAPDGRPCTRCDSCLLRAKGFAELGLADPALPNNGSV